MPLPQEERSVAPLPGASRFRPWMSFWQRVRVLARIAGALLVLLITAADEGISALLGWPPLLPTLRHLAVVVAGECRAAADRFTSGDVVEADVIDTDKEVWR
ncbi:hypothetical protein [Streptosporangium saharense]|uniref:Uncharacterized protein n=1 Tax=Streptosporangium saharense TaxID=1706840 RepID=A0A7W7VK58_9ACTN|nr:hypothetical protein [Streptosporangium saharense]MBB4913336.1 hypothetical protein [Streptosporangium saharense]